MRPGIYREALLATRGGTWRNPLRLRGSPGTRLEAPTIRFSRCGPLVFEDFEIQGPQNAPAVVVTDVPPGVILRGLELHGGSVGIALENASGVLIERNRIVEAGVGVLMEGRGNVLRNNLIENSGGTGVALGGEGLSIDALVRNNSLIRNGRRPTSPGNVHLAWARGTRIENIILVAAPGPRLFTFDGGQTTFSHNLYFSPNGADAAAFSWRDVPRTGFSGLSVVTADPAAMFADPMLGDSLPHPKSPAVDAGIGRPSAGERDLAGNLRRSGSAIDLGAWELRNPPGLRVSGNQLIHQNRVVLLRCVGVGDPLLDRRERPLSDYRRPRDRWNANTVRINVHPYVRREAE